jgi:hypothetical protein
MAAAIAYNRHPTSIFINCNLGRNGWRLATSEEVERLKSSGE